MAFVRRFSYLLLPKVACPLSNVGYGTPQESPEWPTLGGSG
jgi:hypothetical protein